MLQKFPGRNAGSLSAISAIAVHTRSTSRSSTPWRWRLGLRYDSELLCAGCMFHDMGLTHQHSSDCCRFEVDGANAARDFLVAASVREACGGYAGGVSQAVCAVGVRRPCRAG